MGKKEEGLLYGTLIFMGIFVVAALILGEYVRIRTRDKSQSADNRRYFNLMFH